MKHLFLSEEEFFVKLISKYYPLSLDQIERHQEDLNFHFLSENENLDWKSNLIEIYEDRWNYYGICRNKSFPWNEETIKKYKNKEWFNLRYIVSVRKIYLDKNFVTDFNLHVDSTYIADSDVEDKLLLYRPWPNIDKTKQRTFAYYYNDSNKTKINRDTIILLNSLKTKEISAFESSFLRDYRQYIYWSYYSWSEYVDWDLKRLVDLSGLLKFDSILRNQKALLSKFVNNLDENFISEMFEQIKVNQENKLLHVEDHVEHNFTAQAKYASGHQTNFADEYDDDSKSFPDSLKERDFVIGYEYSYPLEFCDYHELDSYGRSHRVRLVSPKLKNILSKFSLPKHKFYPVTLHSKSYWYGDEQRLYYLLVLDSLNRNEIDFTSVSINNPSKIFCPLDTLNTTQSEILSKQNKFRFPSTINLGLDYSSSIHTIPLNTYYDLACLDQRNFYMSSKLLDCLKKNEITGYYINAFKYPRILNKSTDRLVKNCNPIKEIKKQQKNVSRLQFMRDSIQNLNQNSISFDEYIKRNDIDGITDTERKLELIFPQKLRSHISQNILFQRLNFETEYEYYSKDRIEKTQYSWASRLPMTFNGITIASNGIGDYLVLILENNSPYQLSTMVYKLEHETVELIPYRELK